MQHYVSKKVSQKTQIFVDTTGTICYYVSVLKDTNKKAANIDIPANSETSTPKAVKVSAALKRKGGKEDANIQRQED